MSEPALFEGYDDATAQWRASTMQLVNWGGFHGHHAIDFGPNATLISGASGTGKSTILDAYLALMMPANVPFNGASNDATTGRARSASQRNVLTYLRGKVDSTRDGDADTLTDKVLRRADEPVWGAISMTFTDDSERVFTAFRTYYAPAGATSPNEVRMRMFTVAEAVDLRQLQPYAAGRFDLRAMRASWPMLERHETGFVEHVTTRLGIGTAGGGDRALRLLARVQAGHQVKTVDRLYKELVLERPATYAAADRALEQFRALHQTHEDIRISEQKQAALQPIRGLHAQLTAARDALGRLDRLGVHATASPFRLWALRTEWNVLDRAEAQIRIDRGDAEAQTAAARARVSALDVRIQETDQQIRDNGGDALQRIATHVADAQTTQQQVQAARSRFTARTHALADAVDDETSFAAARKRAHGFFDALEARTDAARSERDADVVQRAGVLAALREAKAERRSLQTRAGRVPMPHDRARTLIAEAAGLDPRDLPFAAELMDVRPEHDAWRRAAEDTLRGLGLTMLIDERRASAVRRVMDRFVAGDLGELGLRLVNEAVPLNLPVHLPDDDRYISGRLEFTDGPFTGWLTERVASRGVDHRCVESADHLSADEPGVTVHGQTRRGGRGAHGRSRDQQDVLGFTNEVRLDEVEREIETAEAALDALDAAVRRHDDAASGLRLEEDAHRAVLEADWSSIDTVAAQDLVDRLIAQQDALLAHSDILRELQVRRAADAAERDEQQRIATLADADLQQLGPDWERIVDRKDEVAAEREALEQDDDVHLSDGDAADLDRRADKYAPAADWRAIGLTVELVRTTLLDDLRSASDAGHAAETSLLRVFEAYNRTWPDPNRGVTLEAYPEYDAIYADILHHGLPARLSAFKRSFQKWSGDDLKILGDQYQFALDAIEERLDPINRILRDTPFGAGGQDRLRIDLHRRTPASLAAFLRQLDRLRTDLGPTPTDEQVDARFAELQAFMASIDAAPGGSTAERDRLLDVRQHIEISATRVDAHGDAVSTYTDIAGKSGGETQELVAFIVGAALRYQLGDETRTKPRFAPVILDEGFVKSDSEFASRAVTAWRDLGFQLIIGAPLDKVSALERSMDVMWSVLKNERNHSFVVPLRDADERASVGAGGPADAA